MHKNITILFKMVFYTPQIKMEKFTAITLHTTNSLMTEEVPLYK